MQAINSPNNQYTTAETQRLGEIFDKR